MDRDRSRGQLLLIAGLGIAVTFIVLAVVLNTAIYTENLATRDTVPGRQAVSFEHAAEEGTGGLLALVNYHNNSDYAKLHQQLAAEVRTWDAHTSLHGGAYGVIRGASLVGAEDGTQIVQDDVRNFTDDDGNASWTLATNVTETRRFRMNVTRSALAADASNAFAVQVTNGSQLWRARIYASGTNNVTVDVYNGTTTTYEVTGENVEIDLTQGIVGGNSYPGLVFAEGVTPPYNVSYEHADQVSGRYVLFVDRPQVPLLSGVPGDPYYDRQSGLSPYTVPAVYSANVSVTFERPDLSYQSTVTVAPGAPPGGETFTVGGEASIRELVYVDSVTGLLSTVNASGNVTRYDASNVRAIGPKEIDFDSDGLREIPYLTDSGHVKLIDEQNRTATLAAGANVTKTLLGVGTWRGETSVFYVNQSDDGHIYRVSPGDAPQEVLVGGNGVEASAVAGVADYNGDSDADLIYTGTSQNVKYVDGGNTIDVGRNVGQNNGIGIGEPRQFDASGVVRAPMIDGSNNVGLLAFDNQKEALTSGGVAAKAPTAGIDLTGGPQLETVYVDSSSDTLYYVTLDGSTQQLTNETGDPIKPDVGAGVA